MGEQRNLTEENVEELRAKLEEMHKDNPDLEYRFWEQTKDEGWPSEPQPQDEQPSNKKIFEKLDAIERQLKLIFDGHVLLDGHFVKASDLHSTLAGPGNLVK